MTMNRSHFKSPSYDHEKDTENNEIWTDTSASTLTVPIAFHPSINSYQHFKQGNNNVRNKQKEINVNYFGANDGEIGVLKYKTPFSKGIGESKLISDNYTSTTSGSYIFENSSQKKKNHDAVAPSTGPFTPHMKLNKSDHKSNSPIVKIAIPRPMPDILHIEDEECGDDGKEQQEQEQQSLYIDDDLSSSIGNGLIQMATPTKEEMLEMCDKEGRLEQDDEEALVIETKSHDIKSHNEQFQDSTNVLKNTTSQSPSSSSYRNIQYEKRLSSQSDGTDRCSSPSELSQGAFIRSSVVVPIVKFLPPQPSSPNLHLRSGSGGSSIDHFPDFGPSRGNPSQTGLSGFFEMPLSNRSLRSNDSLDELSSPAQRLLVKDITSIDQVDQTLNFVEQTQPTARSQSSLESTESTSIRSWKYDHATLRGNSFTPATQSQNASHQPRHTSNSIGGSSSGKYGIRRNGRRDKETWISVDDGSTVRSIDSELRPIPKNQIYGWKLNTPTKHTSHSMKSYSSNDHHHQSSSSTSSTKLHVVDDTRHIVASQKAIRRMRAGGVVGKKDLKWLGLENHIEQLKCCDAAHITNMISKVDSIGDHRHSNNRSGSDLNSRGMTGGGGRSEGKKQKAAQPIKVDKLDVNKMQTEPYLLHLMMKKEQNHQQTGIQHHKGEVGNNMDQSDRENELMESTSVPSYFYNLSHMDSIDIDTQQEVEDAKSWDEISNEMNDLI